MCQYLKLVLPQPFDQISKKVAVLDSKKEILSYREDKALITVSNSNLNLVFDKNKGQIISYKFKEKEFLKDENGPRPNFWRAVTDNDFGNQMQSKNIEWKKASLFMKVSELSSNKNEDGSVTI